jgi:hypothetical protein
MQMLVVLIATLALAGGKSSKKQATAPADPNAVVAKAHAGKVWVRADAFPSSEGPRLATWLGEQKPIGEVAAATKDAPWLIHYLGVFKKPAIKGPFTVQFFEKGDLKNLVDQYSPPNDVETLVFQGTYELSPDQGFNKGRSYIIRIGQLIKGKFILYASGQVTLK